MSSTTGIQNLLVNVFRPVYRYEIPVGGTTSIYAPKLELSNIDTYSGNAVSVFTAAVGDANFNVYVGSNAGNTYSNLKNCSNVTAVGYAAALDASNTQNSTYLGYNAGAGATSSSSVIGIGANAGGNGTSNIFIGNGTSATGSNNILIGHGVNLGSVSSQFRLGSNGTLSADFSNRWVGVGMTAPSTTFDVKFDVSGDARIQGNLGVNIEPGDRTMDVNGNFRAQDASMNALDFSNGQTRSSGGFYSLHGSGTWGVGAVVGIALIKRGIINVSAVDQADSANRAAYIFFAYNSTDAATLASSSSANTDLSVSSSYVRLSNSASASRTYDYTVTYFPMA